MLPLIYRRTDYPIKINSKQQELALILNSKRLDRSKTSLMLKEQMLSRKLVIIEKTYTLMMLPRRSVRLRKIKKSLTKI